MLGELAEASSESESLKPKIESYCDQNPIVLSRYLAMCAYVEYLLGAYSESIRLLNKSLEIQTKKRGGPSFDLINTHIDLSVVLCDAGDFENAEQQALTALSLAEKLVGAEHPLFAKAARARSKAALAKNDVATSITFAKASSKIERSPQNNGVVGTAEDYELASLIAHLMAAGTSERQKRERLFVVARDAQLRAVNEYRQCKALSRVCWATIQLAEIQERLGQSDQMEAAYLEALPIMKKLVPHSHPKACIAMIRISALFINSERFEEAAKILTKVVDDLEDNSNPSSEIERAKAFAYLGRSELGLGNVESANSDLAKALELSRNTAPAMQQVRGLAFHYMALLKIRMAEYSEAERFENESLAITATTEGDRSMLYASGLHTKGRIAWINGRYTEADQILSEAAAIATTNLGKNSPTLVPFLRAAATAATRNGRDSAASEFNMHADTIDSGEISVVKSDEDLEVP